VLAGVTPLEEARAVQAMLDEGYTLDGAAQALGWSRQLVTARRRSSSCPSSDSSSSAPARSP
jgi:ParB-like chromosome segregation protein Spo0J